LKKIYILLLIINSVLTFAQFGSKVKFSPENKIKYDSLHSQLNSDLNVLRQKKKEQQERLKFQDGATNYINYNPIKDSLCNTYVNNVSKLVPPDQVKYFWQVVNRRMNKKTK
jgi:hypothetical protein